MSKNSVNYGPSGGAVGAEVKFAGNDSKDKMYEPKHKQKLVRVLTVVAYVFSVSLAAIMLSLFYVFIYNPAKPGGGDVIGKGRFNRTANHSFNDRYVNLTNSEYPFSINSSYSNIEIREEPRALPLEVEKKSTLEGKFSPSNEGNRPSWSNAELINDQLENGKKSRSLRKFLISKLKF